jgi:hypothetical protein
MKVACFTRRDRLRYRYHTVVWQACAWRQIDEGWAVVDDFGDLVTVERP